MHKSWFDMCLLCRLHRRRLLTSNLPIRLCLGKLLHFESNFCKIFKGLFVIKQTRRTFTCVLECCNYMYLCLSIEPLRFINHLLAFLTYSCIDLLTFLSIYWSINQSILFSHKLIKNCLNNPHPSSQLFTSYVLILPHRYYWSYLILYTLPTSSWTQISTLFLTPLK